MGRDLWSSVRLRSEGLPVCTARGKPKKPKPPPCPPEIRPSGIDLCLPSAAVTSPRSTCTPWARPWLPTPPEHGLDVDDRLGIGHVVLLRAHRALLVHHHQVVGVDDAALQQAVQAGQSPKRRARGQPLGRTQGGSALRRAPSRLLATSTQLPASLHNPKSPRRGQPCGSRPTGWEGEGLGAHLPPLACGCQDWVNAVPLDSNAINNGHGQKHLLINRAFHVVNHGETADGFQKVVLWPAGRATESKGVSSSMELCAAASPPPSEGHPGGAADSPSLLPHPHAV